MKTEYHIVSHTHWDREWYQSFEVMRQRLLDLMDRLLTILAENPKYLFHLDAQVICLEDYLEIRPYQRDEIRTYIRQGRLRIGPWYVQNDFFLCSGEATVRNLLFGVSIATAWGGSDRIGYAPDQFGLTAQLPQIYLAFGIRHSVAARGYRFFERAPDGSLRQKTMPMEFDWIGADGTTISAINLACWYNNAQRFPRDRKQARRYLERVAQRLEGVATTPCKLLMNGVDHLEPQADLLPILDRLQRELEGEAVIRQSSMIECLEGIDRYFKGKEKPQYRGELREGDTSLVLSGTLSSRPYLKQLNACCQNLLELELEPLYSRLWEWSGGAVEYPSDLLDYFWKELMKNHAHDSICGCSADRVHQDNENRFLRVLDGANELLRRGLKQWADRLDRGGMDRDDYLIAVVNTLPYDREESIEAGLDTLVEDAIEAFELMDEEGKSVDYRLVNSQQTNRMLITPGNLTQQKRVDCRRIRFCLAVPASGYRTLRVQRKEPSRDVIRFGPTSGRVLENEFLRVEIGAGGTVQLHDRVSALTLPDLFGFEEAGDIGESYWFTPDPEEQPAGIPSGPPVVEAIETGGLRLAYPFGVCLELSLPPGSQRLDVRVTVENRRKNHRLRLLVRTDVQSDENWSSQPFDCIRRNRNPEFPELRDDWTQPNNGLVSVKDKNRQVSVFNEGIYEYEHLRDGRGTLALTLVRATARIANDPMCCGDPYPPDPMWDAPENQCLRTLSYRLAIRPGSADEARLMRELQCFLVPLRTVSAAADLRKFCDGRPYIDDPDLHKIDYRFPPEEERRQPLCGRGLRLDKALVFSAWKRAQDRDGWILRFFNPAETAVTAESPEIEATISDLDEREGKTAWEPGTTRIGPKEIMTLRSR